MRVEKTLTYKLSLVNSHQLSCNSCFRLTRTWELRKLSYKISLLMQLSSTLMQLLFSFDQDMRVEKTAYKTRYRQACCKLFQQVFGYVNCVPELQDFRVVHSWRAVFGNVDLGKWWFGKRWKSSASQWCITLSSTSPNRIWKKNMALSWEQAS